MVCNFEKHKADGCISVEMECAALQAMCDFRELNLYTFFYLVRHGEANYEYLLENGFWGFGRDFAPLSKKGKQQTAQIISRETGIRVEVDIDLHEWIPDERNQYETSEESFAFAREFAKFEGECPPGEKRRWESLSHMRKRMICIADKYSDFDKVILVGHGMAFRCLTYIEKMNPTEIIECTWQNGQEECQYSFT